MTSASLIAVRFLPSLFLCGLVTFVSAVLCGCGRSLLALAISQTDLPLWVWVSLSDVGLAMPHSTMRHLTTPHSTTQVVLFDYATPECGMVKMVKVDYLRPGCGIVKVDYLRPGCGIVKIDYTRIVIDYVTISVDFLNIFSHHATLRRAPQGRPDLTGWLPRCVWTDGRVKLCAKIVPTLVEPHAFVQWVLREEHSHQTFGQWRRHHSDGQSGLASTAPDHVSATQRSPM